MLITALDFAERNAGSQWWTVRSRSWPGGGTTGRQKFGSVTLLWKDETLLGFCGNRPGRASHPVGPNEVSSPWAVSTHRARCMFVFRVCVWLGLKGTGNNVFLSGISCRLQTSCLGQKSGWGRSLSHCWLEESAGVWWDFTSPTYSECDAASPTLGRQKKARLCKH